MKRLAETLVGLDDVLDCTLLSAGACRAAVGRVQDHRSALSADESQHIGHAVESRQFAYSTGRYLAKRALAEIGVVVSSIPTHASRRPVWPDGVVGSITHSRRYAIAVVGVRPGLAGIGVDLEVAGRVTEGIAETVMSPAERDWCHDALWLELAGLRPSKNPPSSDGQRVQPDCEAKPRSRKLVAGPPRSPAEGSPPTAYTANFSAKEAVFKAVNPIVGLMVGFREVEIRWLADERAFTATYVGRNRENAIIDGGRGAVFALDGHVGALFWIDATAT